ncbi:MAG: 5-formyltetrahydrofolate cyclo-ligase [Bifidobacteriaceae bacterium]|jgi:5-formyltetrahydrofolate cyclo-ligase|nr:5-formyltetrahydrofolate cyclo-ligase [Bifidobacteriaceae bacterium]
MSERNADSTTVVPHDSKSALRKKFLAHRLTLPQAEITACGEQLRVRGNKISEITQAKTLAAYVSMGSEIPTLPLLNDVLARGTRVLVPRLGTGRQIGWSYMESSERLVPQGAHRPEEPADAPVVGLDELNTADVILVPAFFIDAEGFRLGRGAGWYDRALLHRRANAVVIGIAYPWETASEEPKDDEALPRLLPRDPHDIPVGMVLTPAGVTRLH